MADTEQTFLATAYTEVCRSYGALHDFRMKLLGLVPIVSVAGFFLLGKVASPLPAPASVEARLIGYVAVFSALFTLALFIYEARGILMCYDLYYTGKALETRMQVRGQFTLCDQKRDLPCYSAKQQTYAAKINDKIASSAVYSLTFAAWLFISIHFVGRVDLEYCALCAAGAGIVIAGFSIWGLSALTKAADAKAPAADALTPPGVLSTPH